MNNIIIQVLVLLGLAFHVIDSVAPRNKFEKGLLKLIEKCRNGDVQSLPVAFPSLNPLRIPAMDFDYDGYRTTLSEVKVKGLKDLSVKKLSASATDMTMSVEALVPTLAIRADRYCLQGTAMFFYPINDKGILRANVHNLLVKANIRFGAAGRNTVLNDLKLAYSVDGIQVQLSGSNGLVNDVVNQKISSMVRSSQMKDQLQHLIKDLLSEYLRGLTPQELVETISLM